MNEKMKENVKPSALNFAGGLSSNRTRRSSLAVVRRRSGNLAGELLEKRKVSQKETSTQCGGFHRTFN